ncbi:Arrestin-N domain-containing protein [Mycena indigotica]|uniref:Arrestin-N domain-containing protein n=1 Tax=Mycena indigotica TaxID=2126181 RepID=A0A8H6WAS7_9AGAR|nr:Arrestin-N domain-containing protein [Mycena indigotica]KAF7311894.1 Arrestin-N domain-containing protein [Mycena indigotica]
MAARPEPMNATTHHAKVKVSLTLGKPVFVAGGNITGKMEMECKADKGLGIGVMMVELYAIQELTSRDHSAKSTFIHSRRLFQGPGLPPSNAVQAHPIPGEAPLPPQYHQARRGTSTFIFKFPLPESSPSSINFGGDLARVRYELRASVGVAWRGEKRLVVDKLDAPVVECLQEGPEKPQAEGVVVAENGKIWAQGKVVGGVVVAGESGCVELQVKNHSTKKVRIYPPLRLFTDKLPSIQNTGLVVALTRSLVLSNVPSTDKAPLQISDTLVTVPFRGQEYIIPPGAEGVASLVFDVPKHARGVRGGLLHGDNAAVKPTHSIFEVQCVISIKMTMGFGSKDIELDLPVQVVHPLALPELPELPPQPQPYPYYPDPRAAPPYGYSGHPIASPMPIPTAYMDPQQAQVWLPPVSHTPQPYNQYYSPAPGQPQYYFPPPPTQPVYQPIPLNLARPLSAEGIRSDTLAVPGLGPPSDDPAQGEEGKGTRASRISQHLHQSTRNRSVSPVSHRYPAAGANSAPIPQTIRGLPVTMDAGGLTVSPPLHSPRPVLSPKTSFAIPSSPKSERVEELERMADEVAKKTTNLSGDLPKSSLEPLAGATLAVVEDKKSSKRRSKSKESSKSKGTKREKKKKAELQEVDDVNVNKTLPGPPVPSGKVSSVPAQRTRIDTYFNVGPSSPPVPESPGLATPKLGAESFTPKTPTIMAVSKRPSNLGLAVPLPTSESGLDALERRLLADVGTRKVPAPARPDARTVLAGGSAPVDIPMKRDSSSNADDSVISSLTLAGERERELEREREREEEERDRDSDERTQGAKKSSSGRTEKGEAGERKSGRKKEKPKEGAVRKAAKGRVAAWLGGIDMDAPPDVDAVPPSPELLDDAEPVARAERVLSDDERVVKKVTPPTSPTKDSEASPNPRSSGFVPVKTFKRDPFQRVIGASPADEAKRIADLWAHNTVKPAKGPAALPRVVSPTHIPQSVHTDRKVSPPSSRPNDAALPNMKSPRLPLFPPPLDPEVKYDIRSARGGRGGKVTAITSLWASGALAEKDKSPPPAAPKKPVASAAADLLRNKPAVAAKSPTSPLAAAAKAKAPVAAPATSGPAKVDKEKPLTSRPVIKSASVPALVSSSHATPTLSSTASLARPTPRPSRPTSAAVKPPPTIVESASEVVAGFKGRVQASLAASRAAAVPPGAAPPTSPKPGDLAFGQARLRDLIKKYQGQTAA